MRQLFQTAIHLHRQGELLQAEAMYRQILRKIPNQSDVLNALGMLLNQRGLVADAVSTFRQGLKANSRAAHIYLNLAETLRLSGMHDEAKTTLEKILKVKPKYPEAWFCLGNLFHDQHKFNEAINCYRKVIKQIPSFAPAYNCLGVALQEIGKFVEAIKELQEAIRIQPKFAEAQLNLANTYYKCNEKNIAQEHYIACLSISPNMPQAHLGLAQLGLDGLVVSEENDKKIEVHLDAASSLSETPEYLSAMGIFNARKGNWVISEELLKKSIQLRPDPNTIYQFVNGKKFTEEDAELAKLIASLIDKKLDLESRALLYFSRGKMLNDIKFYAEAFKLYEEGNNLINKTKNYNPSSTDGKVEILIKEFSSDIFAKLQNHLSNSSENLVFIVGMPRSGTTLTEQVIASHPCVLGAGELFGLVSLEDRLPSLVKAKTAYPELIQDLHPEDLQCISNNYLNEISGLFPGNYLRITDKFPLNFWRIGLISLLFPKAKIIHVKRDPLDCCISNFFQRFADGHDFAYSLQNLAHYYRAYQKLMIHWHSVLPTKIFDLQYEDLTADPEYWSRKLIEYIGLDWDDACLTPHKLDRSVRTASVWQVRQPIYKSSVQRWKNYENNIGMLKQGLGY